MIDIKYSTHSNKKPFECREKVSRGSRFDHGRFMVGVPQKGSGGMAVPRKVRKFHNLTKFLKKIEDS